MTYTDNINHFEWDENKREANIIKHGIDFIDAIQVFSDKYRVEFENMRSDEKRYYTIGMTENVIIMFVVYTYRDTKKRIISARRVSKNERSAYYNSR